MRKSLVTGVGFEGTPTGIVLIKKISSLHTGSTAILQTRQLFTCLDTLFNIVLEQS